MVDLGVKLHPVKKIQLWHAIRNLVFAKMDKDSITPERADEILISVKKEVRLADSPEQAKELYMGLPKEFPELKPIKSKFEMEEHESIDKALTLLLDEFMERGEFNIASELMERIKESHNSNRLAEELKAKYPVEFQIAIKRFSQKFY